MRTSSTAFCCIGFAALCLVVLSARRSVSNGYGSGSELGLAIQGRQVRAPRMAMSQRLVERIPSMCLNSIPSMPNLQMNNQPSPWVAHVTDTAPATEAPEAVAETPAADDGDKEAKAHLRYIRGSTHKYRRVIDTIRGRSYEEALAILQFMPYRACENVLKVVRSAAANAAHNYDMKKSKLYIAEIWADEGPTLKRYKIRAQGRMNQIRKPTSHIYVKVAERQEAEKGSKVFARRGKRRKEVGPNWKGKYIEDPVAIVDKVEFEDADLQEEVVAAGEEAAAEVEPVEAPAAEAAAPAEGEATA